MKRWTQCSLLLLAVVTLALPALAKRNNPDIRLEFRPQQAVAAAVADISHAMLDHSFELRVADSRPGDDPAEIGTRTDDDDRRHTLRAVDEVEVYASEVLLDLSQHWGLNDETGADLVLDISLVQFKIIETNQVVGATFSADSRLKAKLTQRGGKELWSGSALGDATRYGKKFSNENVNEVLSDALLEAFAELLSDRGLQDAWRVD